MRFISPLCACQTSSSACQRVPADCSSWKSVRKSRRNCRFVHTWDCWQKGPFCR
jgi:hypothetical protein